MGERSLQVVVAGASRGLGYELVRLHLERDDRVWALCREAGPKLAALQAEYNGMLHCVEGCDVASTKAVERSAKQVDTAQVDILYNNAAIHRPDELVPLEQTDLDALASMYEVNAVGPLRVTKALLPLLGEGSAVVNISSEAGSIEACGRTMEYAYCMSKAALNMGSMLFANASAERGIVVRVIQPGWMRTDMGGGHAELDPAQSAAGILKIALAAPEERGRPRLATWDGKFMPW